MTALAERSGARRRAIVDAALTIVTGRGFEGLRVRDVARAVGINAATLVYHYPDKEALIAAVVEELMERFRVENTRRGVDSGDAGSFAAHLDAVRDAFAVQPETYIMLCEVAVRARRHPKIRAALDAATAAWTKLLCTLIAAAAPTASAPQVHARAQAAVSLLWGCALRANADGTFAAIIAGDAEAAAGLRRRVECETTVLRSSSEF